jgi:hypothetical protein
MMPSVIEITKDFPPSRERAVLLELLRVVTGLQEAGISFVICGGWVPFLKELARQHHTAHSMSLDIDLVLRAAARERESIDRVSLLLAETLAFRRDRDSSFRYEKDVDGNIVQLDLMADVPRVQEDQAVMKFQGIFSSLDLCLIDGGEELGDHVEPIRIDWRDGECTGSSEFLIPDAAGFLILKTAVCHFREKPKDPYDIYYYCRYSEDPDGIRLRLEAGKTEPAIERTIAALRRMFGYEDSKWVEMALDHMNISGEDRDREARFIVRAVMKTIVGL